MKSADTQANSIDILAPNLDATAPIIAKLQKLPEVSRIVTLASFVPPDQNQKLPIIQHAASILLPLFDPNRPLDASDRRRRRRRLEQGGRSILDDRAERHRQGRR